MKTRTRKGRERLDRGLLKQFSDLPLCIQLKFQTIATEINILKEASVDCYIAGSYFLGFWDNQSDFDIMIDGLGYFPLSTDQFKTHMITNYGINVDIMGPVKKENKLIKIPVC